MNPKRSISSMLTVVTMMLVSVFAVLSRSSLVLAAPQTPPVPAVQWGSKPSNMTGAVMATELYTPAFSYVQFTAPIQAYIVDSAGAVTSTIVGAGARCAWSTDDAWQVCPVNQAGNLPLLVGWNTQSGVTVSLGLTGTKPVFSGTVLLYQSQVAYGWGQNQIYSSQVTFSGTQPITTPRVQLTSAGWTGAFDPAISPDGTLCVTEEQVYNNYDIRCKVGGIWTTVSDQTVPGAHLSPAFSPDGHLLFEALGKIYYQTLGGAATLLGTGYYPSCTNYWCTWTTSQPAAQLILLNTTTGVTNVVATSGTTFSGPTLSHQEYLIPQPIITVSAIADAGSHVQQVPVTVTFSASAVPAQANITYTWYLPHGVVMVGKNVTAVITAAGQLTATVTACNRYGCKNGEAGFETYPNMPTYIEQSLSANVAAVGSTIVVTTTVYDQYRNFMMQDDPGWMFTHCGGHATCTLKNITDTVAESIVITTTGLGLQVTNTLTFLPGQVVSLTWQIPAEFQAGEPVTPTVAAIDKYGNTVTDNIGDFSVTVPTDCALVGSILSCFTAGPHELSASYAGLTGVTSVNVIWGPAARIHGGFPPYHVKPNGQLQGIVEVFNAYGVLIDWPVTWSVDEGSGAIDQNGLLTAPSCSIRRQLTGRMTATGTDVFAPWSVDCVPFGIFLPLVVR